MDKELLFEYMEKLERKEREREQKKEQRRLVSEELRGGG